MTAFSYADQIFMRAVELGCKPVKIETAICPVWRCTCRQRKHASAASPFITEGSLGGL